MARTPLSISTRGRITTVARKTITIATIGWLVIGTPTPPTPGGGIIEKKKQYEYEQANTIEEIIKQDNELIELIKIFLQCRRGA